eukprot:761193-Hanusia_phi.AAC.4
MNRDRNACGPYRAHQKDVRSRRKERGGGRREQEGDLNAISSSRSRSRGCHNQEAGVGCSTTRGGRATGVVVSTITPLLHCQITGV